MKTSALFYQVLLVVIFSIAIAILFYCCLKNLPTFGSVSSISADVNENSLRVIDSIKQHSETERALQEHALSAYSYNEVFQ